MDRKKYQCVARGCEGCIICKDEYMDRQEEIRYLIHQHKLRINDEYSAIEKLQKELNKLEKSEQNG